MINSILFPSDYLNKTIIDEELKAEYEGENAAGCQFGNEKIFRDREMRRLPMEKEATPNDTTRTEAAE